MAQKSLNLPPALKPGDTLAIVSPAAPSTAADLERGVALLEAQGFRVKRMPNAHRREVYLAGSDAERLADLHQAFADDTVQGILCARGGYGCMRLLPQLDFDLVRRNPKVFIGFSDVTALHLAFLQEAGLVGFYGPMLTSNLIDGDAYTNQTLFDMVMGQNPTPYGVPNRDPYTCFRPGVAEGPLVGGNLSLLAALCGTPYQPETQGRILFIEDWKERYYSLDRQFQQLRLAGLLEGIAGLLLCDFSQIDPEPEYDVAELLRRLTADLAVPVGYGFSVGHGDHTATLPLGIQARFNSDAGTLELLESPVV